uniref:Rhodanese domain-containing protein n=1 Tax=Lygus hesperus TaxID=30085 RepID=A0A0K8TAE8_LYGHE
MYTSVLLLFLMASAAQPNIVDLTIPEVLEAGKQGVPIIDVREQVEIHNTGLIPGSVNIPLGHLEDAVNMSPSEFKERYTIAKPGKDDKIILSCMSGNRSKKAIIALQGKGFTNLFNNAGGWKGYDEFNKGK